MNNRWEMDNKKPEGENMKSNEEQLLRDPEIEPSSDVIAKALGEALLQRQQGVVGLLFSTCVRMKCLRQFSCLLISGKA